MKKDKFAEFKQRLPMIDADTGLDRQGQGNQSPYGVDCPVFSVLTRNAVGDLREIHDRMPVILRREDVGAWVKPDGNPQEISQRALTEMYWEKAG